ncbi:MAG: hypothetical protein V2J42_11965 [Wenzhouxiangella sp.]|nr:hypothetical protein [Wenzhouxiangella sp.]
MRHQRVLSGLFGGILAGVLAYAGFKLADPSTPALLAAGLGLCAAAPLMFLLRPPKPAVRQHPVLISSLCGLGCVMIMVGVQRYGEHHQPLLIIALLILIGWMGYQRKIWRAGDSHGSDRPDQQD